MERAAALAETIRRSVLRAFPAREGCAVSCSGGVASLIGAEDAPRLLARADERLYQAKRLGKDRVVAGAA